MGAKPTKLLSDESNVASNMVSQNEREKVRQNRQSMNPDEKYKRHDQEKKKKIVNNEKVPKEVNLEERVLKLLKKHNPQLLDFELINNCLMKHFFMKKLDKEARTEIVKQMNLCEVQAGEYVCKQGTMGFYFYIIKEGKMNVEINGSNLRSLSAGESFGELALIHGANRSASIKSETRSLVYTMERKHFRKICDHIKLMNFEENKKFIESISIFSNIDNDLKSVLANNLIKEYHEPNDHIVREGDDANCMYIIKEGSVNCCKDGKVIRTLNKGDNFGEVSILTETTRTLDVIASTSCIIFDISVETLKSMVGENYRDVLYLSLIKMALARSYSFSKLNFKLIEQAYSFFKVSCFSLNTTVFKASEFKSSKNLVVIIEGNLVDKTTRQILAKRGEILFESSVVNRKDVKLKNDLVADPDCVLAGIEIETFCKELGGTLEDLMEKSIALSSIQLIPLFKHFNQTKLQTICRLIKIESFENGKNIIVQGQSGNKFYIVRSGMVDIFISNNYIRTINQNGYFGERALFFKEPRSATAQANGNVEVYVLEDIDFMSILEPTLKEYLYSRFYLQDTTIELKDLDFLKEVGKGSFGVVSLVNNRKTKQLYALKAMSRNHIDFENLHSNVSLEKQILLKVDHPFIVKLVKTLKDNGKFIFFLMEYVKGKELFDVIRDIGFLNDNENKFYTASILLAINYLHERNIVYRDLKPENIIVCENVSSFIIINVILGIHKIN